MPGCARSEIVRPGEIGVYHAWSRCVQRAYLCGEDPLTERNFDYRRGWLQTLLEYLAGVFAVDIGNYSILANHCHLIARTRPDIAADWSDEEVAWRWKLAWPDWEDGQWRRTPTDEEIELLLADPPHVAAARRGLSSLSWIMARWKEPIARRANRETDRRGHFWEQRFGARQLLDEAALVLCMGYVDLNQIKAGQAASLEESNYSAIQTRVQAWRRREAKTSLEKFHREGSEQYELTLSDVERLLEQSWLAPIRTGGPTLLKRDEPPLQPLAAAAEAPADAPPPQERPEPTEPEQDPSEATDSAPGPDKPHEGVEPEPASPAAVPRDAESAEPRDAPSPPREETGEEAESVAKARPDSVPDQAAQQTNVSSPSAQPDRRRRRAGGRTNRPPQRTIHHRLKPRQRRRASDHTFLDVSLEPYLKAVSQAAASLIARRARAESDRRGARAGPDQAADRPTDEAISDSTAHFLESQGVNPDRYSDTVEHLDERYQAALGHPDKMQEAAQRNGRRCVHGIRHCRDVFT